MNGARPVRCDNAHRGRRKLRRSRSIQLRYRIACTWHANEPRPSSRSSSAFFFFCFFLPLLLLLLWRPWWWR